MLTTPEDNPVLVWDECLIAMDQAKYLVEIGEAKNEDEGFEIACSDSDLYSFEWDFLVDHLTELMRAINPSGQWRAEVKNFGWRKLDGYKSFSADNGSQLLHAVLPKTDCTFRIFHKEGALFIQNSHHDAPTGSEWYTLYPDVAH